ncbi:hypothetical protein CMUS01_05375 [Colletotrichum musicola]|uniref:SRR1-like domain-containing protein n=1 Tax=Colletotrichum musicola TaxID=2175873 RepID=A0A8H6NKZ7_9PEZI|nr:hypothetical protein CMUS01_05375 [Colletotrichum musicola]
MARVLAQRSGQDVQCYAQDPLYSQQCTEYLQSRGFKILDGVRGFIEVDDTSLVFTVAPTIPVKQVITDLARPAVIVWEKWRPVVAKKFASKPP